jgi:S-adenosylmethionine-dependent methyltransferase
MKSVESFYNKNAENEWSRLDRHPLEFEITKKYLDRYIPPKSNILDMGGGPGILIK